jgi:hypothetical protein
MPNATLDEEQNAEDIDDFISKEDKEYRAISEREKPKICWNIERHAYLSQTSNNA